MTDVPTPLSLALWDLRAAVEAQLRCLTKVHQISDNIAPAGNPSRADSRDQIVTELTDILRMNGVISEVCQQAIAEARSLSD